MRPDLTIPTHEGRAHSRDLSVKDSPWQDRRSSCCAVSRSFGELDCRQVKKTRHAVTLVELLITVTIIAILGAVFLGASQSAMESARAARTKTTISKLHRLLMGSWQSYETRRVDINSIDAAVADEVNSGNLNATVGAQMMQDVRLLAIRELMMLEMPDSWSDILLNPVGSTAMTSPRVLEAFPTLRQSYLRRYSKVVQKTPPTNEENVRRIEENQGAECLYMIIMLATADGEARTLFSQQDIGDTDDDGAPEFLDGWGRPIHFIRWPAGFVHRSELIQEDSDNDHDPFDVFRRDQAEAPRVRSQSYPVVPIWIDELRDDFPAFRLVPLIYSSGPDGETDIDDLPYTSSPPPSSLNPFAVDPSPAGTFFETFPSYYYVFGHPFDRNSDGTDNSIDNIHNHLLDN